MVDNELRTRSGRLVKKPKLYEPVEVPVDDYSTSDYDTQEDCDDFDDEEDEYDEEEEDEDSEDADENGNLRGFVVDSDEEEEDLDDSEEEEDLEDSEDEVDHEDSEELDD